MNRFRIIKIAFFTIGMLVLSQHTIAQGIEFINEDLKAAKAKAAAEDKVIFVDAYTSWCGPCKRMAKNIFPQKAVGDYFNKHFVNLKLNMEKGQGKAYRKKYRIRGYPTLMFITSSGEVVHSVLGAKNAKSLLGIGRKAVSKSDFSDQYKKLYDEGNRDYDLIYKYVKSLNKAGKSSSKISNDYLQSQEDLTTPENLKFILLATTQADSKSFDLLVENRSAIAAIDSKDAVQDRIVKASAATAAKAIDYESTELLTEAIDKASKYAPEESGAEIGKWISNYFSVIKDEAGFVSLVENLSHDMAMESRHSLVNVSLKQFATSNDILDFAEKEAKKCCKAAPANHHYRVSLARVYVEKNEKKKAMKSAKKALAMAKDTDQPTKDIDDLILEIEAI